jgi:hypothetical protein
MAWEGVSLAKVVKITRPGNEKGTVKGNGAVYDQKPMLRSWRIKATLTE